MRNSQKNLFLKNYIINNYKHYILVGLLFMIGLFIGVMIINNCNELQLEETSAYINDFIINLKQTGNINKTRMIFSSIKNNLFFAIILWIAGTTVIGMPIVL